MRKLEVGTFRHAFRNEMSEIVHWSLFLACAFIIGMQISQANAVDSVAPINQIYTYFF